MFVDRITYCRGAHPLPAQLRRSPLFLSVLRQARLYVLFQVHHPVSDAHAVLDREGRDSLRLAEAGQTYLEPLVLHVQIPELSEEFGLAWWVLTISAPSGSAFKSFSGKASVAGEILWDGTGTDGELVESAADYYLKLEASDAAGNLASTKKKKLPIDVLVLVTERGLKIRISNIEFAFASARLTRKAYPVLDRVAELLEKYRSYDVLIEGHTDDIGEEEYNLRLSEERSKSVMDYLISEGVSKERLSFRGMGESSPFLPNTGEENRRRNRRVEFLLIKKDLHEEH